MIGARVQINRREDDEMGELAMDHTQVRELLSICERETERRKLCLEIAKEYAKQEDFESARRYLQANYLGSSPSYLKEEQKYLAEIMRRRQEAQEAMRSQDTGSRGLERSRGHRMGGSQSLPNQTEEGGFSRQAPRTRQPVRDINAVTIECNRNALNVLNLNGERAGSNEGAPKNVETDSGDDSEIENESSGSKQARKRTSSSSSRESRESQDTRGNGTVVPGRSESFASSAAEVESRRGRMNPPISRVSVHRKVRSTFKENDETGRRTAEHEQSTGVIVTEPESGTVYMVAQTRKWTVKETDSDSKSETQFKVDLDFDSESEPECCCLGFCHNCISFWF